MENSANLETIGRASARILCSIRSIFPLDTVPDVLSVDENKVTVELRQFLQTDTHVMLISDIADVDLETGAIYATLRIQPRAAGGALVCISNLKKDEAAHARQLISGLMLAKERGVDLSQIEDANLVDEIVACGVTH